MDADGHRTPPTRGASDYLSVAVDEASDATPDEAEYAIFGQQGLTPESFHLRQLANLEARLLHQLTMFPQGLSVQMLYHIADLLTWEVRLHDDVRLGPKLSQKQAVGLTPERDNRLHIVAGARWARNQIAHGRGQLLQVARDLHVDNTFNSPDILFSDPEVDYHGIPLVTTIRFARVDNPITGDWRPDLQPFYDECAAGRRVIVTTRIVRGQSTLAGTPYEDGRRPAGPDA